MSDLADLNPDADVNGDAAANDVLPRGDALDAQPDAAEADPAADAAPEAEAADATEPVEAEPAAEPAPEPEPEPEATTVAEVVTEPAVAEPEAEVAPEADQDVLSEDELLAAAAAPAVESPFDRPGKWYVVHTQSGYEKKVKQNLEARISSMAMGDQIHEVVIPEEDVVDIRGGKRVTVKKKMFPGYLLVRCRLTDESWRVIRETPGVTGFVGQGNTPSPLPRRDVEVFLAVKVEGEEAPKRSKPRLEFEENETVRVKEGPFADFSGTIIEINEDQLKVKVLVNIFGRETPVELEFSQIAKL